MSKKNSKNFKTAFDSLLEDGSLNNDISTTKFNPKLEKRATFIVNTLYIDKLKAIAYIERKLLKETLDEAISAYIDLYEKANGEIPLPK